MLQEEMEGLLLRLASQFTGRQEQLLFLINNYDLVMSILMERTKDDSKESETFREQLKSRSEEFVTLILENHFGQLIKWSKEAERKLDSGDLEDIVVTGILKSFEFILESLCHSVLIRGLPTIAAHL